MPVDVDREEKEVRAVRQLRASGNSTVLAIPPETLQFAGLSDGDEVVVVTRFEGGRIELRPINEEKHHEAPADD